MRDHLFDAIQTIPPVKRKADWAHTEEATYAERVELISRDEVSLVF